MLDVNQGLADEPQPYRAGVQILLPDLLTQTEEVIQLWG
ncbi:Tail protein X [Pseudomonas savastanoi pv. phaseolicola]|nr:Tail protein X [Pseudomonas savastanoi pv. phaseolicola]